VIGVLNAAAGAYYYLRIVVTMYLRPARRDVQTTGGLPVALAVGVCALGSLLFGFFPGPISRASRASAMAAVNHEIQPLPAATAQVNSLPSLGPLQVHN
jgi:NADH-quinone oxidoreductase subunit N